MTDSLEVWIQGSHAGQLERKDSAISFRYDQDYRAGRLPALSVSMPKGRELHEGAVAGRWIDNLLPDNDAVRARWASSFGERRDTPFNLLRHMGADCAGAVQILPEGTAPDTHSGSHCVSEREIEERLSTLRRDPAAWNFRDHGGRWSLGGAQGKFALARRSDGSWTEPTGQSASTHILKVGIAQFAHSDAAEFVTMRAAGSLGLTTARSDLVRFGHETAFVSRRYDRRVDGNGVVQRLHQEDLCQVLGISRASKYEADGGPSVETIARMFSEVIDPRDLDASRRLFMKSLLFNWLVAGTDAHTKNYSLLHIGSRVRLAPLYDLTAAAFLQPTKDVHFKGKLAMKLGGEYLIRNIRGQHIARAAKSLGVEPDWALHTVQDLADRLPDAVESALDEVNTIIQEIQADQFRAGISARLRSAKGALTSPVAVATTSTAAADPGTAVQGIWVAAHTRAGRQIEGHWRKRPGFTN